MRVDETRSAPLQLVGMFWLKNTNKTVYFHFPMLTASAPSFLHQIFCTFSLLWYLERNFITIGSVGNASCRNPKCPIAVGRNVLTQKNQLNIVFTFSVVYCKCPKLFASTFLHVSPPLGPREKFYNHWKRRECELTKPELPHCSWYVCFDSKTPIKQCIYIFRFLLQVPQAICIEFVARFPSAGT